MRCPSDITILWTPEMVCWLLFIGVLSLVAAVCSHCRRWLSFSGRCHNQEVEVCHLVAALCCHCHRSASGHCQCRGGGYVQSLPQVCLWSLPRQRQRLSVVTARGLSLVAGCCHFRRQRSVSGGGQYEVVPMIGSCLS